ncbi:hypothetical protein D1647_15630 [Alistipes sp. Z76]|jgi:hypothetical protein|uniref:DUF6706 family protein n=1 Tax=Prevotella sp. MGM2 TaxID=2033406 RepID=UPI000CEA0330|nr:DUF6706 family protein [Prevotella sp. MGM2]NBH91125.1 hypothetical protein [Muribaculaceae bacterium S4]NBI19451.1 hypothetical protein [Muribaculaceae bacterium Z1]NBJ07591.1 hypothetical protein [Alistipes sp. Z76]NCE69673.1 hypothetical protein [Muribaculaceae bacterium M3]GAY30761.1 hypothetical protein PvtlMGM2_1614 [Prevotella sp. MGM2]
MEITVLEALMAELEPYTAAQVVCKKALIDAGLSEVANDTPYTSDCKKIVATAAIKVLKKFLVLSSESLGKSSQSYDTKELRKRIKELCADAGLDADEILEIPTITDGSMYW